MNKKEEMRKREDIEEELKQKNDSLKSTDYLVIELLLDIRNLLDK